MHTPRTQGSHLQAMGANGSTEEGEEGGSEPTILQLSSGMRIFLSDGNPHSQAPRFIRLHEGKAEVKAPALFGCTKLMIMNPRGRRSTRPVYREPEDEEQSREEVLEMPHLQFLTRLFDKNRSATYRHSSLFEEEVDLKTTPMDPQCDLYQQIRYDTGQLTGSSQNIVHQLSKHKLMSDTPTAGQKISTTISMLPRYSCMADMFEARVFCGTYSKDGSTFMCVCQDKSIYLYDTDGGKFSRRKHVKGRGRLMDATFSPNQQWIAYASSSPRIHTCSMYGNQDNICEVDLHPDHEDHFCAFSVRFSADSRELLASTTEGYLYLYDRETSGRALKIDAHRDDANTVAFTDDSSQVFSSAGDDGLCKVWDRRTLSETNPTPVGIFAGHKDGITYMDVKDDGRYLITNSKDQSIKLWDMRRFSPKEGEQATLVRVAQQDWDYHCQEVPKRTWRDVLNNLPGDTSVTTYAGHLVKHELLRCHFSPMATTGQRYIYVACARGRILIYDVLTGETVQRLMSQQCQRCIRDVSWHPYEPGELVASTWDGYLQMWSRERKPDYIKIDSLEPRRLINY